MAVQMEPERPLRKVKAIINVNDHYE